MFVGYALQRNNVEKRNVSQTQTNNKQCYVYLKSDAVLANEMNKSDAVLANEMNKL
jgi:hypothetical protein